MNLTQGVRFAVPCVVLALAPAVWRVAAQGIQEETIEVDDCKGTGGKMKTQLVALPSPTDYAVSKEITDDNQKVHARFEVPAAEIDATKSAKLEPKMEFAPGSTLGNAAGNDRKFETQPDWEGMTPSDNTGKYQLKASCIDCGQGAWTVTLMQSVTLKLSAVWSPATETVSPGLQAPLPMQVPEWELKASFEGINGEGGLILESHPGANSTATTFVDVSGEQPVGGTVQVSLLGLPEQDQSPGWSHVWTPNAAYNISARALWLSELTQDFSCTQTSTDPAKPLTVKFEFSMAIEDKSEPAFEFEADRFNTIDASLEYTTLVWISRIEVTRNCDNTQDDCPCVKHGEDEEE
jgi:hypothetical protein